MSRRFIYINTTNEIINQFAIEYMINPTIHANKVFRDKVEKYSRGKFHQKTMELIRNVMRKKDTCVISLVIFYETRTKIPIKVYRALICVLCYVMENYVYINYLCCHYKTVSFISSDKIFEESSYNGLLFIGILEVLMNLVYCHGFMKKPNSTVTLVCRSCLANHNLEKGFVILEQNSKQLSSVTNDVKLRIHAIDKQKILFYGVPHSYFLSRKHHK